MPIIVAALIVGGLWIYTITDVVMRADWQVRTLRRSTWIAVVLLTPPVGSVLWLLRGRPRGPVPLPEQRMHPSMFFVPEHRPADGGEAEFLRRFHERVAEQREAARLGEQRESCTPEDDAA